MRPSLPHEPRGPGRGTADDLRRTAAERFVAGVDGPAADSAYCGNPLRCGVRRWWGRPRMSGTIACADPAVSRQSGRPSPGSGLDPGWRASARAAHRSVAVGSPTNDARTTPSAPASTVRGTTSTP